MTEVLTARPTIYKGIHMRSRLEAQWAAHFDQTGQQWEYEPYCFANESGQYLPDFKITQKYVTTYVEVKGLCRDKRAVMQRMEIIHSSEPKAHLELVCNDGVYIGFKIFDKRINQLTEKCYWVEQFADGTRDLWAG